LKHSHQNRLTVERYRTVNLNVFLVALIRPSHKRLPAGWADPTTWPVVLTIRVVQPYTPVMSETHSHAIDIAAATEQAHVLAQALPFLRRYAGATVVVKYGGHAMGDEHLAQRFGSDIALLKQVGINPVVIHGGGPQINAMLKRLAIQSTFIDGLRVTDAAMVEVVEMVLAGTVNKYVAGLITKAGAMAVGICGKDGGMIRARKLQRTIRDPDSHIERALDLGFVGEPTAIDARVIHALTGGGLVPVIAPIGVDSDGQTYNINADTVAAAVAGELIATRLLMLTDVPGVLDKDNRLIPSLTLIDVEDRIADGTITGGMIPKVENCVEAVRQGVRGAVILDGRVPHACLLELFTEAGPGTLIKR
jgi:acetylglutamate kinase